MNGFPLPGRRYRMPTVFGPTPGPRQRPDGAAFDGSATRRDCATLQFLTDEGRLRELLPPGFQLEGEPVVSVEFTRLRQLEWLAGRGYNMLGVKLPARFEGRQDRARGHFLAVLWESRPEPIISGREELGFAKLYAELAGPRVLCGRHQYTASWDGHSFFQMQLELGEAVTIDATADAAQPADDVQRGTLHYRYMPKVSAPGQADVAEAVLTPATHKAGPTSVQCGTGSLSFIRSSWEQLPTMSHIVNALAELPLIEIRAASRSVSRGGSDLSDQKVLD